MAWIGQSVRRREDAPLLTGRGRFIDDLDLPGLAHAAILRSPHAHAGIRSIDAAGAMALPDVFGVVTGADVAARVTPFPVGIPDGPRYLPAAVDRVRYVGEPVAVVVARTRYVAEDARELIRVEYEPWPAVVDPERALDETAPRLHEGARGNLAWRRVYRHGDVERAFAEADVVLQHRFRFPRYSSTPIETLGVVAAWDAPSGVLTVWSNLQGIYAYLFMLARSLGLPEDRFRFIVPANVGGSFGIKAGVYPYITLIGLAAMATGRPVKWIEDRHEHLLASSCHTDRVSDVGVAAGRDGVITAVRLRVLDNVGAYARTPEPACSLRPYSNLVGPYRVRHLEYDTGIVHTNKMPTGPNRGYGNQQHYFALERIVDLLAQRLGVDPAELRFRNLIPPQAMPYTTPTGGIYDSGDYPACLRKALAAADYAGLRARQRSARGEGRYVGVGIAVAVDPSASGLGYTAVAYPPEQRATMPPKSGTMDTCSVSIDTGGKVSAVICTAPHGQGHDTVAAQVVADILGLSPDDVRVTNEFDTFRSAWNLTSGTYSSRFGSVGMSAVAAAAGKLKARVAEIAAVLLEADPADLELAGGRVSVRGAPGRHVTIRHLAGQAHWNAGSLKRAGVADPSLRVSETFLLSHVDVLDDQDRVNASGTYAFIAEVAAVEVLPESGHVTILKYVSVHDAGRIVNPMIAEGQIHGAVLHGIGGALYEEMVYSEDGQPLAGSFMDYLCPTICEAPDVEVHHVESPSPFTALGSKGLGEGSAETAPVVIANAVADALAPLGVSIDELPLTPSKLWRLVRRAAGVAVPPGSPDRQEPVGGLLQEAGGEGVHPHTLAELAAGDVSVAWGERRLPSGGQP